MKSLLPFNKKEDCCGCTACKNICPTQALVMKADVEGFLYPDINQKLCINCGLCKEVCAFQNGYDSSANLPMPDAYAVKHKDADVRMDSRSGGMFTAISDYFLENGGVVYGAGFKDSFVVCHKRATQKIERDEFRGSKYVQSDLNDIFLHIKTDLQDDMQVLFSGTPCQTAALNMYLLKSGVNKDRLFLCDLICHGTPSPKVWRDYLLYMEKLKKGKITKVDFRNKRTFGWSTHIETITINGKEYSNDIYTTLFYSHYVLRPACFNCKYTNMKRPSDLTLGDFWGIDKIAADFNDNKGVSLVFVNTEKGRTIFESVKDKLEYINCTGKQFGHKNLREPHKVPIGRGKFWIDYQKYGFGYIAKKYGGNNLKDLLKKRLKSLFMKLGLFQVLKITNKR